MKILILKDVPGEIKAQKMTYNIQEIGLAIALRKQGHESDVMCVSDDGKYHESHVEIDGQHMTIFSMEAFVCLKNAWLRKKAYSIIDRYDIVQACEYNQMYTRHLAKKYKHKFICYHGPYYCEFNRNYNLMAKVFDLLFVNRYRKLNTFFITKSGLAADYLRSKGIRNVSPIGVGLNIGFLGSMTGETNDDIEKIKKLDSVKLLYIGVNEPRRNSLFLLDVAKKLKDMGLNFTLIMIGRFCNEEYKSLFFQKISDLGLSENIHYIPRMEQKYLAKVYKTCDIFLLPTVYDIYGMVLLESMYFGLPTITTVNGGSNMMIKNYENGIVINDFEVDKWTMAIKEVVNNKDLCMKLGEQAHKTIVEHYTWDKLVARFWLAYKKVLMN